MRSKLVPIERLNVTLGAGAVAGAVAMGAPLFALSVALGTALEVVNFRTLHRAALALFAGHVETGNKWLVLFSVRLALLAAAIGFALRSGADPVGLVLGLSMVVPAALIVAWRTRPPVTPAPLQAVPPPDDASWDEYSVWHPARVELPREEDR